MKNKPFALILLPFLAACATNAPPPTPPEPPPAGIPYPQPDTQSQIERLGIEISRLQQQIEAQETRIRQLERRNSLPAPAAAPKPPKAAPISRAPVRNKDHTVSESLKSPVERDLSLAQTQYRNRNYKAVINTLRSADSGGSGNDTDRQSMFLLMQSHLKLQNCESTINIGNRFATRFRSSSEAPEALFGVAQCQYHMQQRDIARDTWRKLIQTYPESNAAKRARARLNSK